MKTITVSWRALFIVSVSIVGVACLYLPARAEAAVCSFTRDLEFGATGDDVRCLQEYLNTNGFAIAESGVGSKGNETGEFKTLTEAAVIKWQEANNLTPAVGYFGLKSRAKYRDLASGVSPTPLATAGVTTSSASIEAKIAAIQQQIRTLLEKQGKSASGGNVSVSLKGNAEKAIQDALDAVEDAEDEIQSNRRSSTVEDAEDDLEDARDYIFDAMRAYFNANYDKAIDLAKEAGDLARDAEDVLGEDSDDDLADRLEEAWDALSDARDEVEEALDDDEDVGDAEDLLDEAEDLLNDVEDALDDDDEDDAEDLIEEALDLIDEALDEL